MVYTRLIKDEVGWLEKYHDIGYNETQIAHKIGRLNQSIYKI
ncbi:MAG: hypothetical protein ACTHW2_10470 [Tissierella sp.]